MGNAELSHILFWTCSKSDLWALEGPKDDSLPKCFYGDSLVCGQNGMHKFSKNCFEC